MFDPELFIYSLFEDTTQSTLVFDLLEKLSFCLQDFYLPLISVLPDSLRDSEIIFEENYMAPPTLHTAHFEEGIFFIDFETLCELNVLSNNKHHGSVHITLSVTAKFILKNEGGNLRITPQSPPTSYTNYSPSRITFTTITFDKQSVHYLAPKRSRTYWPFSCH